MMMWLLMEDSGGEAETAEEKKISGCSSSEGTDGETFGQAEF